MNRAENPSSGDRAAAIARRATSWQLARDRLQFGPSPHVMGIVNVTPDSFSDGGEHFDEGRAVDHALRLADDGAHLLDVGGESTRPYAASVSADEEKRRVIPVVRRLARETAVPISIDTSKASVAREALDAGAQLVNDITAGTGDAEMLGVVARSGAGFCLMHMRGTPQTMQDDPRYDDVVAEVHGYLAARRDAAVEAGVESRRIALDPGIGFGKRTAHNLELLRSAWRFHDLGCPVLIGHSRKGFIGKVLGNMDRERLSGTIGVALAVALQGVQVIRVHDVQAVVDALKLFAEVGRLGETA